MNLREQIRQLKRQRAHELRTAGYLYARTRRDLTRSLSPDRFIRRHIGLTMGAAALAGMLLAPAPKYQKPEKTGGSRLGRLLAKAIPPLKRFFPEAGEEPAGQEKPGKETPAQGKAKEKLWGTIGQLAAEMLPFLLNRQTLARLMNRRAPIATESAYGPEPTVSVANAGATATDRPFDGRFSGS